MDKRATNFGGTLLVVIGGLALLHTTILPWFGWEYGLFRLWPMMVGAVGLCLVTAPLVLQGRGIKALFIPGVPVLVVGALLMWSSIFNGWGIWTSSWPLIVLGLAAGFGLAALGMRNIWLLIPAIILGVNGLIFQFCAITGLWDAWAILWTLEPLAVGLSLLVTSAGHRRGLMTAGLILTMISVVGFSMMSFFLSGWLSSAGAIALILGGGLLIRAGGNRRPHLLPEEQATKEKLADVLK